MKKHIRKLAIALAGAVAMLDPVVAIAWPDDIELAEAVGENGTAGLGAARLLLDDDVWEDAIVAWMEDQVGANSLRLRVVLETSNGCSRPFADNKCS